MIRIGDFARIMGVTVSALRHYDDEDLLTPSFIHPETGYRFYQAHQISDLHRILALKSLGLSLPEIKSVLASSDPELMKQLLSVKKTEAEQRLQAELEQIQRIESRLLSMSNEAAPHPLEVIVKTAPAFTAAIEELTIPTNDMASDLLCEAYDRLFVALSSKKIDLRGPAVAHWHQSPEVLVEERADAMFPIADNVSDNGLNIKGYPPVKVASVTLTGPHSQLRYCHVALSEWMALNHFQLDGAYREIYHSNEQPPTTEVQYPIIPE